MPINQNYLIISYNFPPDPVVGSRRWAKFSKYLKLSGNNVTVICSKTNELNSSWDTDIVGMEVIRLSERYPNALNKVPNGLWQKGVYKFWTVYLRIFVKGTIYDRAIFWKKQLQQTIKTVINDKKIDTIIVNGPPHRLIFYVAQLRDKYPEINFWCDLRDPWTWWYNMGYATLNKKNRNFENSMEQFSLLKMDKIFVPIVEMKNTLCEKYPEFVSKIEVLPHGFDSDDIPVRSKSMKSISGGKPIKLIYFGSLYLGLDDIYKNLALWFNSNPNKISLDLYTNDHNYKELFSTCKSIKNHKTVSSKEIFTIATEADYFLLVYPSQFNNYFATKFYELIAAKIPIIYIGTPGETAEFITKKELGYFFDINKVDFNSVYNTIIKKEELKFNDDFIEDFNFKNLTQKLMHKKEKSI